MALLDSSGNAIPFQIEGSILGFVAALNKSQTATYTLQSSPADRSGENSDLRRQWAGDNLEIGNAAFTLRVPALQSKTFAAPLDIRHAPSPLLGIRHAGGSWYGGSHVVTRRTLSSYRFSLVEQGKASITCEARYRFAPQGEYACRLQVVNGLPYALCTEEFDFGTMSRGQDFLVLDIASGWSPDTYRYMDSGFGGGESPLLTGALETSHLASYVANKTGE